MIQYKNVFKTFFLFTSVESVWRAETGGLCCLSAEESSPDSSGPGHSSPAGLLGQCLLVLSDVERALQARDRHVVLLRVETTQSKIIVELCRGKTHLES